jgi:uncharacterized protein (TIGR01319 family)
LIIPSNSISTEKDLRFILATDVGSTTTKARFFKKGEDGWRYVTSGEAPTTVEAPYEDVTLGVLNAVREIEELTGHRMITDNNDRILMPYDGKKGVDLYCTTSSAGGGLQMMVGGVVTEITAASANRAVLGAGSIVMDILALDDGRLPHEKISRIKNLRPDMILLAGGTDGGTVKHVVNIAEIISAANPKCRLGEGYKLPLVYAGNVNAREHIKKMCTDEFSLVVIDNIRPDLDTENIEPARRAVHELFMEHVMSKAPGYTKLMKWTEIDIMPTPAGEGNAMRLLAKAYDANVLGVGLGGATTNIYSVFEGRFVRSVSANLGMSYSISNVLKETGIQNILRWIPFRIETRDLQTKIKNKMIRPTTIPQTLEELIIEHAVAREALRLGLQHHRTIATRLKGVKVERNVGDILGQTLEESYIKMDKIGAICGTGGLLSHAPRRVQSMIILSDAFQPEGFTRLFQDSVFMMPHLGLLSTQYPDIALQIFERDCLVPLGTIVSVSGDREHGEDAMEVQIGIGDSTISHKLKVGEIIRVPLPQGSTANVRAHPGRGLNLGQGEGHTVETEVHGGVVGLVLDARGRPLKLPEDLVEKRKLLLSWFKSLEMYPPDLLNKIEESI